MAIRGWVPAFGPLTELQREIDRLFDGVVGRQFGRPGRWRVGYVFPPVNVRETDDEYLVECELPGLKMEDLEVTVTGDQLTVAGTRPDTTPTEGATLHRRERDAGDFSRALTLPGAVAADRCEARLKCGILSIRIPKAETAKPKRIEVWAETGQEPGSATKEED
jgi:HSP20 family protein